MSQRISATLRDHFIPHEGNHHTPHVLRHRALFGYSAVLVLLKVLVVVASVMLPAAFIYSSAVTAGNIIALTNATRDALGLSELRENTLLDSAAQAKANDMMSEQYFAHTSPTGVRGFDWIHSAGYAYTLAGENLAVHYTTSEDVNAGWLASPTHRANIVNERFSEIGVGVVLGEFEGYETIMVVQMFGEPVVTEPVEDPAPIPEPITVPEPEPQPEPVPVPEPTPVVPLPPVIDTASANILPVADGYRIEVAVTDASQVKAQVSNTVVPLIENETDTWSGTVPIEIEALAPTGEAVTVIAGNELGEQDVQPVAIAAPDAKLSDVYAFADTPEPDVRLFGIFPVGDLDDMAARVYFFTILALGACLLVSLLAKFEHHRHSVTAHTLLVIILAGVLAVL